MQQELSFFPKGYPAPSAEERRKRLEMVWDGFVGNDKAINRLKRVEMSALGLYNRCCGNFAVAVLGKSGCGKTEAVRRHCEATALPTVRKSAKAIRSVHGLFADVQAACEQRGIPLVECGSRKNYVCPPVNVFIDEVHALSNNVVQGMLTALERKDATMQTEEGVTLNCRNVHWIIATTDRGKLFDAFDNRFMKVNLKMYCKEDVARIVKANSPDWPDDVCMVVAKYSSRIPREALDFAKEMRLEYEMNPDDWLRVAATVAHDNEIDQYGMSNQRLCVLKALGQGPVAAKRLPTIAGCKEEELDKFVMPWLMEVTEDQESFVTVSNRGYTITEAGLAELDKRNVPHKGAKALAA